MRLPACAVISTLAFLVPEMRVGAQELSGPVTDISKRDVATPAKPLVIQDDDGTSDAKLPIQLGLTLGGYWDDNIYSQPRGPNRVGDFIWSVVPVISYSSAQTSGLENSVQVSYSPGFVFYQRHEQETRSIKPAASPTDTTAQKEIWS